MRMEAESVWLVCSLSIDHTEPCVPYSRYAPRSHTYDRQESEAIGRCICFLISVEGPHPPHKRIIR